LALPPISPRTAQPQPAAQPGVDARTAAQRAFFEAALRKVGAPAAAARPAAASAASPVQVNADAQPSRILRPGSLIDIKV
jgi:hypothetical protein